MKDKMTNLISWVAAAAVLVLFDQYTKAQAVLHLKDKPPVALVDHVFELLYSENRGAAFGIMQGQQLFFLVVALVVFGVAAYAMYRMPSWQNSRYHGLKICIILITAGAIGNMIDRIGQGYVVDFLYFSLINFPIFNVADIYVTVATALLLVLLCFYYKDKDLEVFQLNARRSGSDSGNCR